MDTTERIYWSIGIIAVCLLILWWMVRDPGKVEEDPEENDVEE